MINLMQSGESGKVFKSQGRQPVSLEVLSSDVTYITVSQGLQCMFTVPQLKLNESCDFSEL